MLELFLETTSPDEDMSSGSEDDDILQELSGLIDDLFEEMFSSSSSSENTEAEDGDAEARARALRMAEEDEAAGRAPVAPVAANEGEQNNSEEVQNQQQGEKKK